MKRELITVLNDGECWSAATGTFIYVMNPEHYEALTSGHADPDVAGHFLRFDLTNPAHLRSLALYLERDQ
ncbi:MAG: hypothetical protein EBT03_09420 [Betaproteobacteria bacterium]|nr:hypothetical protein [Betaproteobacteria bacterium]NCA17247.1 hypothetical protein [Betaproteobacteria bacterium]